jgi:ATP-dependent Clp protease ATP-binding subunit ClpC
MHSALRGVQRWLPLILAAFFALSIVQVGKQLGWSLTGADALLRVGATAYPAVAAAAALLAVALLLLENWAGPDMSLPEAGTVAAILRTLTARRETDAIKPIEIDAKTVATALRARVVGQDAVCDDVAATVRRRLAMVRRDKPVAVFLLAGPPGTGKTLLAKQLALALRRELLHLDMAQFGSPHAATSLFGSPRGFVGSDSYGRLTDGLRRRPDAVVLLDEIEKAHPEVLKRFLVAWNDGVVTEASDGSAISCARALFVLTTNAATKKLAEASEDFADQPDRLRDEAGVILRDVGFAPEVLDRIDSIFVFHPLDAADIETIAGLELETLIREYGLQAAPADIDQAILFDIMRTHVRRGASARDLARAIEGRVSDALIGARNAGAKRVRLVNGADGVAAEVLE